MRNKAPLALMELLIMLLVFAMASALCMQAFSTAKQQALHSSKRDSALLQAQNAAELLKYYDGDFLCAAEHMGGTADGLCWNICYDRDWNICSTAGSYRLLAERQESDSAFCGKAVVSVYDEKETLLCSLPVAWQEVDSQ